MSVLEKLYKKTKESLFVKVKEALFYILHTISMLAIVL